MDSHSNKKPVVLVAWGQTAWEAQRRLTGDTHVPLTEVGRQQVRQVAATLAGRAVSALFRGPEEAARETADLLAAVLNVRPRKLDELHELDLGHWEGLTESEFRERFPTVYRQWHEDPTSVCPPQGESLADAAVRLEAALAKALRRADTGATVIVTGPLALATLTLRLESAPLEQFWQRAEERRPWSDCQVAVARPARRAGRTRGG